MSSLVTDEAALSLLGVFAKYWQPGTVKTRLARRYGHNTAAAMHRAFVQATLRRFAATGERRLIGFTPTERRSDFVLLAAETWQVEAQAGGNLGERMERFFDSALVGGARRVVLMGSDSPDLPRSYVAQAFDALQRQPVVLGPAADGGYYLVGLSQALPQLFHDIAWSTPLVWSQTVQRLRDLKVPFHALPPWQDVDEPEDLEALLSRLSTEESHEDPHLVELHDKLVRLINPLDAEPMVSEEKNRP